MQTATLEKQLKDLDFKNDEFEKTAEQAIQITEVLKESDLSEYIPHGDGSLSKEIFSRMKEINRKELAELIRENIIEKKPRNYSSPNLADKETNFKNASLEEVVKLAAKKVGTTKPSGICFYILYKGKRLHHGVMETLGKRTPEKLKTLIIEHILSKEPQKYEKNLEVLEDKLTPTPSADEINILEETIEKAFKRRSLKIKEEKDICRYIPHNGRFMHPQAWKGFKRKEPKRLTDLIQEHVLSPKNPKKIKWTRDSLFHMDLTDNTSPQQEQKLKLPTQKEEAQEGSKLDALCMLIQELLQEVRSQKDVLKIPHRKEEEADGYFSTKERRGQDAFPDRYLRTIQNQLIKKIRRREVDFELWDTFVDFVEGEEIGFS